MGLPRTMMLVGVAALLATRASADTLQDEIDLALGELRADDRVLQVYGALGVQRIAREQWGLELVDRPTLRSWQKAMVPCAEALVVLLGDDDPLQWVDATSDKPVVDHATTPRREAERALLALERASVEPLIAALDGPKLAPHADGILRRITGGGPGETTRKAWQTWWSTNASAPLRNEHGHWGVVTAIAMATIAGVVLAGFWLRRTAARPSRGLPSLAPPRS